MQEVCNRRANPRATARCKNCAKHSHCVLAHCLHIADPRTGKAQGTRCKNMQNHQCVLHIFCTWPCCLCLPSFFAYFLHTHFFHPPPPLLLSPLHAPSKMRDGSIQFLSQQWQKQSRSMREGMNIPPSMAMASMKIRHENGLIRGGSRVLNLGRLENPGQLLLDLAIWNFDSRRALV